MRDPQTGRTITGNEHAAEIQPLRKKLENGHRDGPQPINVGS
jgi:hypothetical protein